MKKQKDILHRGSVLALGALVLGLSMVGTVGQVSAADPTSKVFGTDAFGTEYSRGILFRDAKFDAVKNPMKIILPSGGSETTIDGDNSGFKSNCYKNKKEENNVYVEIKNGAIYNNEYLDVREYIWLENDDDNDADSWCYRIPGENGSVTALVDAGLTPTALIMTKNLSPYPPGGVFAVEKGVANIKLRFYDKAGKEVGFNGVVGMDDFEIGEQYKLVKGGRQVYLRDSTLLKYIGSNGSWGIASDASSDGISGQFDLWVEVNSTSSNPLELQYIVEGKDNEVTYRASAMMMDAVTVSYKIVGDAPEGITAPSSDIATQYGVITPKDAKSADGYTFDGWYYDKELKNKVGTYTDKLNSDTTLYGKYVKDEVAEEKEEAKEEEEKKGAKTPDTGLFTGDSGSSKFGGVVAVASIIAVSLAGYAVYKNRKHLFHKIGFGKKGF